MPALVPRCARAPGRVDAERALRRILDDQVLNFRRLIDTQLKCKGGYLSLPKAPGLGCGFDEKAVKHYALARPKPWTVMR